jgi:hypothetical protein
MIMGLVVSSRLFRGPSSFQKLLTKFINGTIIISATLPVYTTKRLVAGRTVETHKGLMFIDQLKLFYISDLALCVIEQLESRPTLSCKFTQLLLFFGLSIQTKTKEKI